VRYPISFSVHLHPDHTGDLVNFIFASNIRKGAGGATGSGLQPPRDLLDFYEGLRGVYGQWVELEDGLVDIVEMSNAGPDFINSILRL